MNHKLISIIAAASLLAASAVSCGKTAGKASSDAVLDIKSTGASEASSEADEKTTTKPADDKKEKTTTTSAKDGEETTTKAEEEVTEPEEDDPAEPATAAPVEPDEPEPATEAPAPEEPPARSVSSFGLGDLDQPISNYSSVTSGYEMGHAPGCLSKGDDGYVCNCGGVNFEIYSQGGTKYIYSISLVDGTYSTDAGVRVGSSSSDILAAYSNAQEMFGDYCVSTGNSEIYFTMSGDTVSNILITCK